jgi:ribonuclease P protein component
VKRRFRLTRSTDFQRVRQNGKSYAHPLMVLVALPNPEAGVRIGVTAGRSVGNAVQRNRAKRILRSAVQPVLAELPPGWDIVLIARQPLVHAAFHQAQDALAALMQRAKLLNDGRSGKNRTGDGGPERS